MADSFTLRRPRKESGEPVARIGRRQRFSISTLIALPSLTAIVASFSSDSYALIAGQTLLGGIGLIIAAGVARGRSWARTAYWVWGAVIAGVIVVNDIRAEPVLWKVAAGFCLYAGLILLIGFGIRPVERSS